eukprot:CAMPEP_0117677768 /NCGR_PEP_ID=MMETSP0804-20121206/16919_1 /TAXON_ID=1074897 /ORGANISM="Tetraselmis astigmatica, Strain CCMP880" /LENGTH=232 /DNA_ID=CAMNT_0005487069 /DNA_START=12 /DNA_END=710 /DNA_ORIENTATION=-
MSLISSRTCGRNQMWACALVTVLLCLARGLAGQEAEAGAQIQSSVVQRTASSLDNAGEDVSLFTVVGKINPGGELTTQDTRVLLTLSGGKQVTEFVRLDGSFTLRNVPVGIHVLEAFHLGFLFPQIRIEVVDEMLGQHVRASYVGGDNRILPYPLLVQPMGKVSYFEPRQGFSWRSFLFQPQILMMLFMIGGLFILPKMAIDPEQMKEVQASMAQPQQQPSPSRQQPRARRD